MDPVASGVGRIGPQIPISNDNDIPDSKESQNKKIKRTVGIIIITVGLVLAAASFGVSYEFIPLPVTVKVILGLALGVASVICLIVGTILKNKNTPKVSEEKNEAKKADESEASAESHSEEEVDSEDEEPVSPREKVELTLSPRKTVESDTETTEEEELEKRPDIIAFLHDNPTAALFSKGEAYKRLEENNLIPDDVKQIIEQGREQLKAAKDQPKAPDSPIGSPYFERKEPEDTKAAYKLRKAQIFKDYQASLKALLETK